MERDLPHNDEFFLIEDDPPHTFKEKKPLGQPLWKTVLLILSALLAGAFLLVAAGAWFFTLKKQIPWVKNEVSLVEFPLSGESLIIAEVKSHWEYSSLPATEGELPELRYVPSSEIKIHKKSGSGQMRCFYVGEDGRYIGDPFTSSFRDGQFPDGDTVSFTGSQGFTSESDFNAYFSGYGEPWYIDILEGTESSNTLSEFKKIGRIPLYYKMKEAAQN